MEQRHVENVLKEIYTKRSESLRLLVSADFSQFITTRVYTYCVDILPIPLIVPAVRHSPVFLGFVCETWTLSLAPADTPEDELYDAIDWDNGSLIHLDHANFISIEGRLNTILLAATLPKRVWKSVDKEGPICYTVMHYRRK